LPLNLFELGDVVLLQGDTAINQRSLCLGSMSAQGRFDEVHGYLDFVARKLEFE